MHWCSQNDGMASGPQVGRAEELRFAVMNLQTLSRAEGGVTALCAKETIST
jgi:hypothetical protein